MFKIKLNKFCLILLLGVLSSSSIAQKTSTLTLDKIFTKGDFYSDGIGEVRWIKNGDAFTTLERGKEGVDIVSYDTKTQSRKVLVSANRLRPEGVEESLKISNYHWSKNGGKLLIYTNTARVWRSNTRGDYWVLDLKSWELKQLGGADVPESSLMFAKFSPDGSRVAYVKGFNIYIENLNSGNVKQMTTDGSRKIINGTFDWVYEEEFFARDGFRWSPDGKKIAFWQLDASGIRDFYMINNTDSLYPFIVPVQYPKVNTTNSSCRIGVIEVNSGDTKWMDTPGNKRENYLVRMEWAANSSEVVIQHLNRKQNVLTLLLGNASTGTTKPILVEKDEAWVDVVEDLKWMNDGKQFTWISERDGWRHLYVVSRDGKEKKLITKGDYDVIEIQNIDIANGYVYYIASPGDPIRRYLYRIKLDGTTDHELLSPLKMKGTHKYYVSPDSKYAFHWYSTVNQPPVISLVTLPNHKVAREFIDNKRLSQLLEETGVSPVEFFKIENNNDPSFDGWMIKPLGFDASKKYPVLFYVYGEPAIQIVSDKWSNRLSMWHQLVAQQGYIVIGVDNRGAPAPRGRSFRKSIYQKIGVITSKDQATAAKAIQKWDFIDPDRIGVWGASGGGSLTLNLLFRYPEIYKVGISVAPITRQDLYDTAYEERYMGLKSESPEAYKECSAITYAKNLKGDLLLIHGTGDDNVHYQNAELLINELILQNKLFSFMPYPNRTHGIYEGKNTTRHKFNTMLNYLMENLPAGGK